jgi:hypothetical protein
MEIIERVHRVRVSFLKNEGGGFAGIKFLTFMNVNKKGLLAPAAYGSKTGFSTTLHAGRMRIDLFERLSWQLLAGELLHDLQ